MSEEQKVEEEIKILKGTLQSFEDTDPLYMGEEMQDLRHRTMYTHSRMEESLGHLIIKNQLEPLGAASVPQEVRQAVFSSGTTIAVDIPFYRKVEMAEEAGQINSSVAKEMHKVNNLRKWFSHPSKFQGKLTELKNDRSEYKNALEQLAGAHKSMNQVFGECLPEKK